MNCLIINSYAGSLLIGVKQAGLDVVASFETDGYGQQIQQLNYPKLVYIAKRADWPRNLNLRDTVVVGHPPCAAFSHIAAYKKSKIQYRGLESPHLLPTFDLLSYSVANRAAAIILESVDRAYQGLYSFYDELSERYGYHVYRILLNSITFGVSQWRPRFWCVLIRKDLVKNLRISWQVQLNNVEQVLGGTFESDSFVSSFHKNSLKHLLKFLRRTGLKEYEDSFSSKRKDVLYYEPLLDVIKRFKAAGFDLKSKSRRLLRDQVVPGKILGYTAVPKVICLAAPTILGSSWLIYKKRNVTMKGYQRLMGFPDDYSFGKLNNINQFLSRGVCPQIPKWLVEQVVAALSEKKIYLENKKCMQPGETLDIRPNKRNIIELLNKIRS